MPIMDILSLIDVVTRSTGCHLLPPSGLPDVGDYELPSDLKTLYSLCGGLVLFENEAFGMVIARHDEFLPANPFIVGQDLYDEVKEAGGLVPDISDDWFVLAYLLEDSNTIITIDLNKNRCGRCYDSSMGRHANPGYSTIIALSFTDFLSRTISIRGRIPYWDDKNFEPYGDAYDPIV